MWPLLLVAAAAVVAIGSSPQRARAASAPASICLVPSGCATSTTSSSTSSTPSSTSASTGTTVPATTTTSAAPPPTTQPSPYTAALLPCGPGPGACNQSPTAIQVRYPPAAPASAVQVDWLAGGRAPSAPDPSSTSIVLAWSDGSDCGSGLRCWAWPAQLTSSSFILNGTYRVVACGAYSKAGGCGSPSAPQDLGLAVPPGAPAALSARSAGSQVSLSWAPPPTLPPDLVGYIVARNGQDVYSCSTDGLGPAASTPCSPSLTVIDRPGNGTFAYAVRALRLGVDSAAKDVVAGTVTPADSGGKVTVPGPVVTPSAPAGGAGSPAKFTESPVIGSLGTGGGGAGGPGGPGVTGAGQGPTGGESAEPGVPGAPRNLEYPTDNPVVGRSSQLALKVRGPAPHRDVVPAGILALGVLAVAVAAHLLYLRGELGRVQARLAERRALDA